MNNSQPEQLFADDTAVSAAAGAAFLSIFGIFLLVALAIYIVSVIAMWKLFTKAGEAGWKSLIPVYNMWVFLRLGDQAGWWALVALIPLVNIVSIVFMAIAAYNIGLKLGKEGWYVVLYLFVPVIWMLILGFDKSTWKQTAPGAIPSPVESGNATPEFVPAAKNTLDK